MNRSEKANLAHKILNRIYKKVPIPLTHRNKFELVVAVLLSAQCTDQRVNKVTSILFKKANTAQKMIKVSKNTIYKIIRFCLWETFIWWKEKIVEGLRIGITFLIRACSRKFWEFVTLCAQERIFRI